MMNVQEILFNGKKNVLWGVGANGRYLLWCFLHLNYPVDFFCDSDVSKQGACFLNKMVLSPSEIVNNKEKYNILVTVGSEEITDEIIDFCNNNGIVNCLTWKDLAPFTYFEKEFSTTSLFKIIRDTQNKKLIIYGADRKAFALRKTLEGIGIDVEYMVDDIESEEEKEGISIRPVYELIEEDSSDIFIIIMGKMDYDKSDILHKMGFCYVANYNFIIGYFDTKSDFVLDPCLGHNYRYNSDETPGIMRWGDGNRDNPIIVTSGGSTTDSYQYYFKSWPQLLYELLLKNGYQTTVINAACSSYKSSQELVKLQRDIIPYQPDVVLSYTGVNDYYSLEDMYPFLHDYQHTLVREAAKYVEMYGLEPEKKGYVLGVKHPVGKEQRFVMNVRMMHAVCKEYGICFHSFLQPSLSMKKGKFSRNEIELIWGIEDAPTRVDEMNAFFQKVKDVWNEDYMTDVTDMFDDFGDVYMDYVHVTEKGNEVIAEYMYNFLLEKGWLSK